MDLDEEIQPQIENPAVEDVETKPKPLKNRVKPQILETKVPVPTPIKPNPTPPKQPVKSEPIAVQPGPSSLIGRRSSPPPNHSSINLNDDVHETTVKTNVFVAPFSKQQTVAMAVLAFALFIKSLVSLIALREIPDKHQNEVFYTLTTLLSVSMFLNFCNTAILFRLGLKKDDETKQACEPCGCCGPYMWKPRYMSSEQLLYMVSFTTLLVIVVELCIAVVHINVFSKLNY